MPLAIELILYFSVPVLEALASLGVVECRINASPQSALVCLSNICISVVFLVSV